MNWRVIAAITVFALTPIFSGCATTTSIHKGVHHSIQNKPLNSRSSAIFLPVDISVYEFGVGNLEEVPEWTKTGTNNVKDAVDAFIASNTSLELIPIPTLNTSQQQLIKQHISLYYPVMQAQRLQAFNPAWEEYRKKITSTIGPGINFLKDTTGADYAVLVTGQDFISSSGRKASFALAALFGVAIPMGQSYLNIGLIELETGNILWNNTTFSATLSFNTRDDVKQALQVLFENHPLGSKISDLPQQEKQQ